MKTLVMIPTYEERENIGSLIADIQALGIDGLEIVVVDDDSRDGTPEEVRRIATNQPNVHLLLRTEDRGRGRAGRAGFLFCLERGANLVVEMDADYSHDPRAIPSLLAAAADADLVLGSRCVEGGVDMRPSLLRKIITLLANTYIRAVLGIRIRDCNSGFRCFRADVLRGIRIEGLESKGPDIVQEVLYKTHLHGYRIKEVPVTMIDRRDGSSKLGMLQLWKGYTRILELRLKHLMGKL